jgi:GT2 family glycosyltransferase
MTTPVVTILVDTYNHERFIEEALTSVMEQDFPAAEMEILVVDDGSTDRTPEMVRKFEPRVRLIRKTNGGQASAFNAGIAEARGEVVAFLDGDDWWARNKLARVAEAMSSDRAVGLIGNGIVMVYPDGRQETQTLSGGFRFRANTAEGARLFRVRKSLLGTSRMTIRRRMLEQIAPVPEAIRIEADEYLFTLAAAMADAQILPEPLTFYRLHDANSFQFARQDSGKALRKHECLVALSQSLTAALERAGIEPDVRREITEIVEAEADQVRLSNGGGWPWETARAEWRIHEVLYPQRSCLQATRKLLSLLPALVLPPRVFYQLRRRIAGSDTYARFRSGNRRVEKPEIQHLERS